MPFTKPIGDRCSVTIRSDRRRGGGWQSEGDVFETMTCADINVTVRGEGRTLPAAEARGLAQARAWCCGR